MLENYAETPTKNVLTTQSCQANISKLLSHLNLSSRKRSCVYQYGLVLITTFEYINNINDYNYDHCSDSVS
jgi:hypothetical protein